MLLFLKSRRKAVNPLKKLNFEVQLNEFCQPIQSTANGPRSTAESWCDWAMNPNLNTCFCNGHKLTVVCRPSTVGNENRRAAHW